MRVFARLRSRDLCAGLLATAAGLALATPAFAQVSPSGALLLEVALNGRATGLIVPFERRSDGRLAAPAAELAGLRLPVAGSPDARSVPLDEIPGLTYRYDEQRQMVALSIAPDRLVTRALDAGAAAVPEDEATDIAPSRGAVLSYSLVLSGAHGQHRFSYSGASAALDARVYGFSGEVRQTELVGHGSLGMNAVRLDSAWTRIVPSRREVWTVGDTISGATPWSRPIRVAGVQVQRDFRTRPDLVTIPLPAVSGSAAVPSSLDVYVNGVRGYAADVPEGRFRVDNVPAVTGAGNARVVLRDVQGREIETVTPFYVSNRLLRGGLTEGSLEIGFARRSYGARSFDYDGHPVASGSGRMGVSDTVTMEGHVEASGELGLAGIGGSVAVGPFGALSGAAAGSRSKGRSGALFYTAFETGVGPVRLSVEAGRATGGYRDLAALTANPGVFGAGPLDPITAVLPPKATERATASFPVIGAGGSLSLNYAHEERRDRGGIRTASAFYQRNFACNLSANVTVFRDFGRGGSGVFAGVSLPFGSRSIASAGVTRGGGPSGATFEAQHSLDLEPGGVGWRVGAVVGERALVSANLDYRSSAATLHAQIAHSTAHTYGNVAIDGSVVVDRAVFFTPRVENAFAIVDTGTAHVPVSFQNRPVGQTNARGLLLVTDLRPFERNRLSIDPDALPVDLIAGSTAAIVRPIGPGGVHVAFALGHATGSVLHLVDAAGRDLPVGAELSLNGGEARVIGYDGLVPVEDLAERNAGRVTFGGSGCVVTFVRPSGTGTLDPLVCRAPTDYADATGSGGKGPRGRP